MQGAWGVTYLSADVLVAIKPHTLDFEKTDFAVLETHLARLNHLLDQLLSSRNGKRRTKPEAMADELDREGSHLLLALSGVNECEFSGLRRTTVERLDPASRGTRPRRH